MSSRIEDGDYSFYHNDHLGTPQKMTDTDGDVVWSAVYGTFGNATVDPASTVTSNLRFPGQYFDEETGLHYNWHRYFDSGTGRYISKDPIGFKGRDENFYRYVNNDPANFGDAFGLLNKRLLTGSLVGIASNTVGVVAGGLALGAPTGITQVLGFVVLTKSTAGLALNVNNLLMSIYGGKELPTSLATYIAFKVSPCNKKNQTYAAALDLVVDLLFSMGARSGVAAAEKAAIKASLENANLTLQQVKYASPTELGTVADTFYILSLGDTTLSVYGH